MASYTLTNKNYLNTKVNFIKAIRATFGIGLKEAKEIADQFSEGYPHNDTETHMVVRDLPAICDYHEYRSIKGSDSVVAGDTPISTDIKQLAKKAIDQGEYFKATQLINILTP